MKSTSEMICKHSAATQSSGLVLVTVENSLEGDHGIAQRVCDALDVDLLARLCRFDLGVDKNLLGETFAGHHSAIIVDATRSGSVSGSISITDLSVVASGSWAAPLKYPSTHGLSLLEDLILTTGRIALPKHIILFAIEVSEVDWTDSASSTIERCLPSMAKSLSRLVLSTLAITHNC